MVKDLVVEALQKVSGEREVELDFPENEAFGDFSSNIALILAKKEGKSPKELAEKIKDDLEKNDNLKSITEKIEIAGAGFINFWLKKDALIDNLIQIVSDKEKYGRSDLFKSQKVMFEYAHPNTHKAFHIGHLRNITTGESLARLFEAVGAKVIRVNYQGDVGLHIVKALWGMMSFGLEKSDPGDARRRAELLGKAYAFGASMYEENDKIKEEIHAINAKIYDKSDKAINKLYNETRQWSLDYFDTIYERVYTKFDRFYFESEVADDGKKIALNALKKGILEESEGAVVFPGSKYGLHDRVFISGKGVPTYEAKDLGLAKLQFSEYNPDKIIHTVGPEQTAYFKVVFKAIEFIMPDLSGRELHIPYGWVRLKKGKMSSRTGQVILGAAILDDAKASIKKSFKTTQEVAESVAVGAVKYSFLKTGLNQDIAFDVKESISLEGNSGPYLQYTVARTNSVLDKARFKGESLQAAENLGSGELAVLRALIRFTDTVSVSAKMYSPNLLCNYLYDLAQKFNAFYSAERIIGSDNEKFRLALTFAAGQILKNGLNLLGIVAPEKM